MTNDATQPDPDLPERDELDDEEGEALDLRETLPERVVVADQDPS